MADGGTYDPKGTVILFQGEKEYELSDPCYSDYLDAMEPTERVEIPGYFSEEVIEEGIKEYNKLVKFRNSIKEIKENPKMYMIEDVKKVLSVKIDIRNIFLDYLCVNFTENEKEYIEYMRNPIELLNVKDEISFVLSEMNKSYNFGKICETGNIELVDRVWKMYKEEINLEYVGYEIRNKYYIIKSIIKSGNLNLLKWYIRTIYLEKNKEKVEMIGEITEEEIKGLGEIEKREMMMSACNYGKIEIAEYLYENVIRRVNFNHEDLIVCYERTFAKVCKKGNIEMLKWMYSKGGIKISKDYLAFENALENNNFEVFKWLYELKKVDFTKDKFFKKREVSELMKYIPKTKEAIEWAFEEFGYVIYDRPKGISYYPTVEGLNEYLRTAPNKYNCGAYILIESILNVQNFGYDLERHYEYNKYLIERFRHEKGFEEKLIEEEYLPIGKILVASGNVKLLKWVVENEPRIGEKLRVEDIVLSVNGFVNRDDKLFGLGNISYEMFMYLYELMKDKITDEDLYKMDKEIDFEILEFHKQDLPMFSCKFEVEEDILKDDADSVSDSVSEVSEEEINEEVPIGEEAVNEEEEEENEEEPEGSEGELEGSEEEYDSEGWIIESEEEEEEDELELRPKRFLRVSSYEIGINVKKSIKNYLKRPHKRSELDEEMVKILEFFKERVGINANEYVEEIFIYIGKLKNIEDYRRHEKLIRWFLEKIDEEFEEKLYKKLVRKSISMSNFEIIEYIIKKYEIGKKVKRYAIEDLKKHTERKIGDLIEWEGGDDKVKRENLEKIINLLNKL